MPLHSFVSWCRVHCKRVLPARVQTGRPDDLLHLACGPQALLLHQKPDIGYLEVRGKKFENCHVYDDTIGFDAEGGRWHNRI